MKELKSIIVEPLDGWHFSVRKDYGPNVEIVDEFGFTGHDPSGSDVLEAYIARYGHEPRTQDEMQSFGELAMRTADYHSEIFAIATQDMDLFGLEEPDLREAGSALSLGSLHASQVYPFLSEIRTTRVEVGSDNTVY